MRDTTQLLIRALHRLSRDLGVDAPINAGKKILELFPEARSSNGKIDPAKLMAILGDELDKEKEKFSFTWPGKAWCFKSAHLPTSDTVIPDTRRSVNFKRAKNLLVEGDPMEALKLLQYGYTGKAKLVYAKLPPLKKLSWEQQTAWLNLVYPKLYLSKKLVSFDGAMCVSCRDAEVHLVRMAMDEIFGEGNFTSQLAVETSAEDPAGSATHLVIYAKNSANFNFNTPGRRPPKPVWSGQEFHGKLGRLELQEIFETDANLGLDIQSTAMLEKLAKLTTCDNDLIVNLFAGTGELAHAVSRLNARDGQARQVIMLEQAEPLGQDIQAGGLKLTTLTDVCVARLRRAGLDLENNPGVRVFKVAESNFDIFEFENFDATGFILNHRYYFDRIKPGRTKEDVIYELILKTGMPLDTDVEAVMVAGKQVYRVDQGSLVVCMEHGLTLETLKSMAGKTARILCAAP